MTEIKSAQDAVAKARIYLKEMLGHPYFETETIDTKQEGKHWIIKLELVHMMRSARSKYQIRINKETGIIEEVTKIESDSKNNK